MLVLSRKINQRILIGGNVRITVVRVDHGKVRIGIEAPPDVKVIRDDAHVTTPKPRAIAAEEAISA